MPKINIKYQCWIEDAEVEVAYSEDGDEVDVKNMTSEELLEKLNNAELFLFAEDYIFDNKIGTMEAEQTFDPPSLISESRKTLKQILDG